MAKAHVNFKLIVEAEHVVENLSPWAVLQVLVNR